MSRFLQRFATAAVAAAAFLATAADASACAACFGKSNDKMFTGYIVGAVILIGFVCTVFVGIVAFGIHMNRRASRVASGTEASISNSK